MCQPSRIVAFHPRANRVSFRNGQTCTRVKSLYDISCPYGVGYAINALTHASLGRPGVEREFFTLYEPLVPHRWGESWNHWAASDKPRVPPASSLDDSESPENWRRPRAKRTQWEMQSRARANRLLLNRRVWTSIQPRIPQKACKILHRRNPTTQFRRQAIALSATGC